ncbi:unnamed protein product [Psylliodes chrysocephalus]|uniref:RRM domain-containing protein n=1 Tax=Psylliodes chrysocephalus TaxID=3402493 RepID=A0A9P0D9R0_9CUCU|nr:unnamed protein product [Psylliodes chrysocephala]
MSKQRVGNRSTKFRPSKSQKSHNTKNGVSRSSITKRPSRRVQDARQKIIQKKRKTVTDARDILSKMAKTQDARSKINKIRDGRSSGPSTSANIRAVGHNILKKTDRNGKISLITNKSRQKLDINFAIQKQLGLVPSNRSPPKRPAAKRNAAVNTVRSPIPSRKHSILNELDMQPVESVRLFEPAVYKWVRPELRESSASQMINSLEATRQVMREALREELSNGWPTFASHNSYQKMAGIFEKGPLRSSQSSIRTPSRLQPASYIDLDSVEDEDMPLVPVKPTVSLQGTSRITNVHSRLDDSSSGDSHGIFSQKTKVLVPAGHRIVVSNLQQSVTQDDIKELFEDIGQLLTAKLVRPGVAEVIYKNLKDAQKAVDTYHNRQLDGQPMKCLLVNKRPLNYPTSIPLKSESIGVATRKMPVVPPCPPKNSLAPDLSTIHRVLFHRK